MFYKITSEHIEEFQKIGSVIDKVLNVYLPDFIKVGMSGMEIHDFVEKILNENKITTIKNFVIDGYRIDHSVHISNLEIISHGNPNRVIIQEEDILKVDLVGFSNGIYCDAARSYVFGNNDKLISLVNTCKEVLIEVQNKVFVGDKLSKIGSIIENLTKKRGFFVFKNLCGHGILDKLHAFPNVPNVYMPEYNNLVITDKTVLCVEPLISLFQDKPFLDKDFSLLSSKGNFSSHFENTLFWSNENKGKCISFTGSL